MTDPLAAIRARRQKRVSQGLPTSRTCDGCDLCCTGPSIKELDKPTAVPCKHLCGEPGRSCSIYAQRPNVCADFHCLWRLTDAVLPDWLQPIKCGFLIAFNNPFKWPGVLTVYVDPARPDAWNNPWAQTVFATLADEWNCIVAIGQVPLTTHLFTPRGVRIDIADNPQFMHDDGTVGAPSYLFGPDQRPLFDRVRETLFDWKLMPPPEAIR